MQFSNNTFRLFFLNGYLALSVIPSIYNETSRLRLAYCCRPNEYAINQVNAWISKLTPADWRRHPETHHINPELLLAQYESLIDVLFKFGVQVIFGDGTTKCKFSQFARDPIFVIRNMAFLGGMIDSARRLEVGTAKVATMEYFDSRTLGGGRARIEGGDVLVLNDGATLLVGVGESSNIFGYLKLRHAFLSIKKLRIFSIRHNGLHLDCCVNALPDGTGLIRANSISSFDILKLKRAFKRIVVISNLESFRNLSVNFLWLNNETVISERTSFYTNDLLDRLGYNVIDISFSELISIWGSIRCVCAPIIRDRD